MNHSPDNLAGREHTELQAATWVLRHDRGLTPAEQDEFSQWLATDSAHGECFATYRQQWAQLDQLSQWRPAHSARPNPDLLAAHPRRRGWFLSIAFAAAAVIVLVFSFWRWHVASTTSSPSALASVEQRTLEDGSIVDLNRGAVVSVEFAPDERRVKLEQGEAHFIVAKNAARPFVVIAGGVKVRAVGTIFNVRLGASTVEVLVTEGRVRVNPSAQSSEMESDRNSTASAAIPDITAGQRAVVSLDSMASPLQISTVSNAEIEKMLAWQFRRLDFTATPLSEIVAEFNRRNSIQLIIADPDLGAMKISTSFRSDNVSGFVRLLESGFGVRTEYRDETVIVLHKDR
ncbi:MAG: FecR domain-containing protein [Opitutaceae bacterium]|jgi:transmembrane sensor